MHSFDSFKENLKFCLINSSACRALSTPQYNTQIPTVLNMHLNRFFFAQITDRHLQIIAFK